MNPNTVGAGVCPPGDGAGVPKKALGCGVAAGPCGGIGNVGWNVATGEVPLCGVGCSVRTCKGVGGNVGRAVVGNGVG